MHLRQQATTQTKNVSSSFLRQKVAKNACSGRLGRAARLPQGSFSPVESGTRLDASRSAVPGHPTRRGKRRQNDGMGVIGLLACAALDTIQVRRYLTSVKTTISSKGQIVLPAEFRQMDRVEPGQEFDVERLDRGEYRLVRRATPSNEGAIDWLASCPQKGFFLPIDSESTDAL
jgi:bifunctional DNA-binding transcriptional regulator/antitoxin component of YhaV-PrlF toxin-antitoxin module